MNNRSTEAGRQAPSRKLVRLAGGSTVQFAGGYGRGVAWVIENLYSDSYGFVMRVQHITGTLPQGNASTYVTHTLPSPLAVPETAASIMGERATISTGTYQNNSVGIVNLELLSTTQYRTWVPDNADPSYRFDVVEWPNNPLSAAPPLIIIR